MSAPATLLTEFEPLKSLFNNEAFRPEQVCAALAKIFSVDVSEVGLLRLQGRTLSFLFPLALQTSGFIPLSSSALAAETAQSMKGSLFNNFAKVRHDSIFEVVAAGAKINSSLKQIQKLMSAPVIHDGACLGVIQICRKGINPAAAGPDFDLDHLAKLQRAAVQIGQLMRTQKISQSGADGKIVY